MNKEELDYNIRICAFDLGNECKQMVEDGELTDEDASFRYEMVKDEILWMMDDPE